VSAVAPPFGESVVATVPQPAFAMARAAGRGSAGAEPDKAAPRAVIGGRVARARQPAGWPRSARLRWLKVLHTLNELQARLFVAEKALELGRGGVTLLSRLTGLSRPTIYKGMRELRQETGPEPASGRLRRAGGGRKRAEVVSPLLLGALERLLTRGAPPGPILWTTLSTRAIARELARAGHRVSAATLARCLHTLGFTTHATRGRLTGAEAQFRELAARAAEFLAAGDPILSLEIASGLQPLEAIVRLAVEALGSSLRLLSSRTQSAPTRLLVCADAALIEHRLMDDWRGELQGLVDALKLPITACHYPPGATRWRVEGVVLRGSLEAAYGWSGAPQRVRVRLIAAPHAQSPSGRGGPRSEPGAARSEPPHAYEPGTSCGGEAMPRRHWTYTLRPKV
jgi:hypothetical protein